MTNVTPPLALMLIQKYLSGLRHYPLHEQGQKCLAMYLERYALSVEHAKSIVEAFRDDCPTPQELHDRAFNEKDRGNFLPPQPTLKEKWEAEGFTLDETFYKRTQIEMGEKNPPRQDDVMCRAIKRKLGVKTFAKVPIGECWAAAQELGYPLNSYQREEMERWRGIHGGPKLVAPARGTPTRSVIPIATAAEIGPEPPRCPTCSGTGRLAFDEYCGCKLGRDLQKVEQGRYV